LFFAARVLSASEAMPYPIPGPDYVVERVAALPQLTIRAITQTQDGYLWIGTYNGLIRFDGVRSISYDLANTRALSSDGVFCLYEDRLGDLWIGTDDGGVIRYREGEFQSFGAAQGLTESEVRAACEDKDGRLWVGTGHGLFYKSLLGRDALPHPEQKDRFTLFETTNLLASARITTLVPAPDGSLWIGTEKGLFRLRNGITESVSFPRFGALPEVIEWNVQGLAMDSYGVLWANLSAQRNVQIIAHPDSTEVQERPFRDSWFQMGRAGTFWLAEYTGPSADTLLRLEGPTNVVVVARFPQQSLASLCEDLSGNIWVGLESYGVFRVRRKQVRAITIRADLPSNDPTTLSEDRSGRVWVGTFRNGLFAAEPGALTFESVRSLGRPAVTTLGQGADNVLWVGTYGSERFRWNGTGFVEGEKGLPGCRTMYQDRQGGLWVGTLINGVEHHRDEQLTRYTSREGLASDRVQCLAQDPGGDMWIGTLRGLNRISAGEVIHFSGEDVLTRKSIRALYADQRGALWIGMLGAGLGRFHKNQLQIITTRQGLPSDAIEQILEDDDGHLWLGTRAGIVRMSRDELDACAEGRQSFVRPLTLGPEDGMAMPRCGTGFQPSCMKSRSGILWFCTPGGLVTVDPKSIRPSTQPPPVYIEEATADDQPLALGMRTVTVPPGARRVSFRYTALSFSAPEKIMFRYRLEGYDDAWVNAGATREATYTRLPASKYQFRVSAGNKDGVWNTAGAVLDVVVLPAWWQTWWFRVVAVVCLMAIVLGAYEIRVLQHKRARTAQELFARRLIESQEQERKRVAAELHDSLGQSLQVIKGRAQLGLNRPGDSLEGTKQFEEISTAASQAIQEVRAISHALRPAELDQLGLAKAIEWMVEKTGETSTTRFGCEVDGVDRFPPEIEITIYRIAQEGINNVLKHANAAEAILQLQREAAAVRFSIYDNGCGFEKPPRADGQGLMGIAERVRLLGGKFEIQSAPGKGTRLTVAIPLPADRNPNPHPT
jgi:signal transduction histidine kinase/ligand-binding sensor domain-containing protein